MKKYIIGGIIVFFIAFWIIVSKDIKTVPQTNNTNTPSSVPVIEKFNISVKSQIVKKIDNKYRYFFSVQNADSNDFTGRINIAGKTGAGIKVVSIDLDFTSETLQSGTARSVYSDANTAPKSVNNEETSVSTFTYTVTQNNQDVASGDGIITNEFENSGL